MMSYHSIPVPYQTFEPPPFTTISGALYNETISFRIGQYMHTSISRKAETPIQLVTNATPSQPRGNTNGNGNFENPEYDK